MKLTAEEPRRGASQLGQRDRVVVGVRPRRPNRRGRNVVSTARGCPPGGLRGAASRGPARWQPDNRARWSHLAVGPLAYPLPCQPARTFRVQVGPTQRSPESGPDLPGPRTSNMRSPELRAGCSLCPSTGGAAGSTRPVRGGRGGRVVLLHGATCSFHGCPLTGLESR